MSVEVFDRVTAEKLGLTDSELQKIKASVHFTDLEAVYNSINASPMRDMLIDRKNSEERFIDTARRFLYQLAYEVVVYVVLAKQLDTDVTQLQAKAEAEPDEGLKKKIRKSIPRREKQFIEDYNKKSQEIWDSINLSLDS